MKTAMKKVTKMLDPRSKAITPALRGRPPLHSKSQRRTVAKYLRRYGLSTGLQECFNLEGFTVSIPTAMKIAKEKGITFTLGRPVNA
jgi:hypothetical protein